MQQTTEPREDLRDRVVRRVDTGEAVAEGRQPLPYHPQCFRVAVDPDDVGQLAPGEQCLAVPAEPERGVHEHGTFVVQGRLQEGDDPVEEDRGVGRGGHRPT